ncbi:hypothetical protein BC943DRAFT_331022 [Umbelopsis sp. AD052]|nr:hypothetical protein BC943DRAFT_331022 [Umbelopsis sp. AD052]
MQSIPPQYYAPYGNATAHYQPPPPHMMQQQQQPPMGMGMSQLPPQASSQPELNASGKPKRKQVKNACVNCQKACKKCDDGRPCQRCVKYGLTETCIDSVRKERKKGVKRGPYKRRNQANSSSASASPTPTPSNLYAQSPATANPGMRQPLPFNYSQFPQYDSFNATSGYPTYGYSNMMPPNYQHNPSMVSYQGLGVMPSPHHQQQQQQHDMNGRPVNHSPQYQQQQQQQQPQAAESKSQPNEAGEDEDGNKLSILSQLCSAVLDNTDAPKQEEGIEDGQTASQQRQQQSQEQASSRYLPVHSNGTPPPSRGHSRTSSFEQQQQQQQYPSQFGHDSPHTYVNGQLRANVYGTPNSSPSNSPVNNTYNKSGSQQPASGSWPLPSLQSVVSPAQNNQGNWQQGW